MAVRKIACAMALLTGICKADKCRRDFEDALSYCDASAAQTLLDSYPAQKTCESASGQPLHLVSQFFCSHISDDCFHSLMLLLESGADPNAKNPKTGLTVLHTLISEYGGVDECMSGADFLKRGVRLLISFGADSEILDDRRRSVVDLAKKKGASQDIINLLQGKDDSAEDVSASAVDANGDADEEENEAGGGEFDMEVILLVSLSVFLAMICAVAFLMRRKVRDTSKKSSQGVVSTPIPKHVSTTTQGSQEVGRAASGTPAPMIIIQV